MKKKILVEGMKCGNCAKHVKEALIKIEGVNSAEVNLSDKYVIVETKAEISEETIKLAVNTEKYNVVGIETL
ncbi:heavy-metal-associated domain-containing protein [Desnuesiella massiliensis]|uniref:heavy-metal-associated domain-containing protein n=1 Tax=Desnuesiella massiliensis TaxID=1650662 RepID=UPI0006E2C515|nr:cation transporter [Desnuesiella massiliensis]